MPHRARPSTPFLPAPTVSSATDPLGSFGAPQVCCALQPAMGFARFRAPATTPRKSSSLVPSPLAHTLRSVPLPGSRSIVTAVSAREGWAFTDRAQSTEESVPPSRRFRPRAVDAPLGFLEMRSGDSRRRWLSSSRSHPVHVKEHCPWTCPFGEGPAPEPRTSVAPPVPRKRHGSRVARENWNARRSRAHVALRRA